MRPLRSLLVLAALTLPAWLAPAAGAAPSLVKLGDFSAPVYVTGSPGDASRLFVVEQGGKIQLLVNGARQTAPFLDVSGILSSGEERGLLSMAFAPDYQTSGRFWIYVTVKAANASSGTEGEIQVREYRRADANHANPSPVKVLLTARHDAAPNHNGGQLQVGPDGMLWLGTGDGGGADNDAVAGSAQDVTNPLGKIMRIDPNGNPFGVPAGNPFTGAGGAAPAVWAYGLRNPWRFSFDRATGDLVIADVGQNEIEEVDWAPAPRRRAGANYGWPCREGANAHNSCTAPNPVGPTLQKTHSGDGYCAIVGGYVVRDPGLPSLAGRYIYGDNCSPGLRSVALANPAGDAGTGMSLAGLGSFGEDACGHVFATSVGGGGVYRIQDGAPSACSIGSPGGGGGGGGGGGQAGCGLSTRASGTRSVTRRRYLRLALRAKAACSVTVSGRIRGVGRIRTTSLKIAAGQRRTVRLRVTRKTNAKLRRALRRHRSVRLTLTLRARDAAGAVRSSTRRVSLRRP
jgi:glucose/arabinose dehydrogenase